MNDQQARANAIRALLDICPTHTVDGKAVADPDCSDCHDRLAAARMYLRLAIEDVEKALDLP